MHAKKRTCTENNNIKQKQQTKTNEQTRGATKPLKQKNKQNTITTQRKHTTNKQKETIQRTN